MSLGCQERWGHNIKKTCFENAKLEGQRRGIGTNKNKSNLQIIDLVFQLPSCKVKNYIAFSTSDCLLWLLTLWHLIQCFPIKAMLFQKNFRIHFEKVFLTFFQVYICHF